MKNLAVLTFAELDALLAQLGEQGTGRFLTSALMIARVELTLDAAGVRVVILEKIDRENILVK